MRTPAAIGGVGVMLTTYQASRRRLPLCSAVLPQYLYARKAMDMSGKMSCHCGQTLGKTLKGDEEPWVDDVYDYLLEGLEEEEGHEAAVSSQAPRKASI